MPRAASPLSTPQAHAPKHRSRLSKRAIAALVAAGIIDVIFHVCFARMMADVTVLMVAGMIGGASSGGF